MKIAVPLFKERVAPYFGSSARVLLVEADAGVLKREVRWDLGEASAMEFCRRLVDLGVEKVICGGIESCYKDWLAKKGVIVLDNFKGPAGEVVRRLLQTPQEEKTAS